MMQYGMKIGDAVLYYNASITNPHIAGIARVCSQPYPDPTAFDRNSPYFDPSSDPSSPTWYLIDVRFEREFPRPVYLAELRHLVEMGSLSKEFTLFRRSRLSIHPLTLNEYEQLVEQSKQPLSNQVKLKVERSKDTIPHPSRKRGGGTTKKSTGAKRKKKDEVHDDANPTKDDEGHQTSSVSVSSSLAMDKHDAPTNDEPTRKRTRSQKAQ